MCHHAWLNVEIYKAVFKDLYLLFLFCVCVPYVYSDHRGKKGAMNLLEMEVKVTVILVPLGEHWILPLSLSPAPHLGSTQVAHLFLLLPGHSMDRALCESLWQPCILAVSCASCFLTYFVY